MLDKPSLRVLSALASLEGDKEFEVVSGWLRESLQSLYATSVSTHDETRSRWMQGGAQVLEDFLSKANTARDTLNKNR